MGNLVCSELGLCQDINIRLRGLHSVVKLTKFGQQCKCIGRVKAKSGNRRAGNKHCCRGFKSGRRHNDNR